MKTQLALIAVSAATLAACASPEDRIVSQLMDYGLGRNQAVCMADELVDRLSTRQLRALADAAKAIKTEGRDVRDMSVGELAKRVTRLGDPELVAVLTRAGFGCAVLGGDGFRI